MRKVTFGVATSLDNFIAREDGSVDWLKSGKEAAEVMTKFWKKIDAVLMGRKTYEVGLRLTGGNVNLFPGITTYVFSRTLSPQRDDVEVIASDAVRFLRKLKRASGKEICVMGGGELARPLFEAKLIDELGLSIQPVLLGSGIPLFHRMRRQIDLELRDCRRFRNGCVYVTYRVKY